MNGEFQMQTEIKAYSSLISRVDWAHPVFGQIFAACLHNDTVVIYQESIDSNKCKRWMEQCRIVPASPSPLDVSFCPSFFGLSIVPLVPPLNSRRSAVATDVSTSTVQAIPIS